MCSLFKSRGSIIGHRKQGNAPSYRKPLSKGIAYTEIEGRVFPAEIVDPPFADGIVRIMQLDTPVEPQHGELD